MQVDLADDETHPIPVVHALDTVLTFAGGGAYIGIVIATPLDGSARSLARLAEKQRFYLESFFSASGKDNWNTPREGKMKIYVDIHADSSLEAFALLHDFSRHAQHRGVEVIISTTTSRDGGT
jgi:hypothetical protein